MTQRILIITTASGSQARVQSERGEAISITFATMDEAWQWAKNLLAAAHAQTMTETAREIEAEEPWNGVL